MIDRARSGSILIVVMFVMTALSLLVVSFAYTTSLRTRAARDRSIMARLQGQARSAVAIAIARIDANQEDFDHPAQPWAAHGPLMSEGWLEEWSAPQGQDQARFVADYQAIDEQGKLNIAYAADEALLKLGLTKAQVAVLRDWTDADEIAQLDGAEGEFYLSKPAAHRSKNLPVEVLDELLLLRGFSAGNYYGAHALEAWAMLGEARAASAEKPVLGLVDVLTVCGDGKINLNTAPQAVLKTLPLSSAAAEAIIEFRAGGMGAHVEEIQNYALRSKQDIDQLQGLTQADKRVLEGVAVFRSSHFRIFVCALDRWTGLNCRLEVLVRRGDRGCEVLQWKQG